MKRLLGLILMAVMLPGLALAQGPRPVSVYLNGENMMEGQKDHPIVRQGRTFLPLRPVAQDLGFKVDWDQDKKEVAIVRENNQVTMTIGSQDYWHNKEKKKMDVKPFLQNDRTYVPVRFTGEALGSRVDWDGENRLVLLGDYCDKGDMDKGQRVPVKDLDLSYVLPISYKEALITKEEGPGRYSFYDRVNYDSSKGQIGRLASLSIEKDPVEIPVPHILLAKGDRGYLCLSFASDVQWDQKSPEKEKAYKESIRAVKEIAKTVRLDKAKSFSEEEIAQAKKLVEETFSFPAGHLERVWYEEDQSSKERDLYLRNGKGSSNGVKKDNVLVLFSNFSIDQSEKNPVLSPGSYENYQWILIRASKSDPWKIDDQGY